MKKIITAVGDLKLNKELSELTDIEIVGKDIPYKEGIMEILEEQDDIDIIIISEIIPGNNTLVEIIEKIKIKSNKIKIIVILEKENIEIQNKLYEYGIKNIFYNNKTDIIEIINLINNKKTEEEIELKREIEKLKKIIEENQEKNIDIMDKPEQKEGYIITITGAAGSGKSVFVINLAYVSEILKKKILIIDFDIFNSSIKTIFGIQKKKTKQEIKNNIIKISKKIDLISINEDFYNEKNIKLFIEKIIMENKNKYNLIIIDTTSDIKFNYNKILINNSNKIIFLIEPNLSEIKKSKILLNIYLNEWDIFNKKINIVLNKTNQYSIDENIIKNIFNNIKIIGKLKLDIKYNLIINKKIKSMLLDKKIKIQYQKIINRILKEKGSNKYGKCFRNNNQSDSVI